MNIIKTIGERLKYLRKDILKLSQRDFGNLLSINASTVTRYETSTLNITDRTISDICREFSVNEDWLRNGNGPIFIEKPTEIIDILTKEYNLDFLEKSIISNFVNSDEKERKIIINFFEKLLSTDNTLILKDLSDEQAEYIQDYLRVDLEANEKFLNNLEKKSNLTSRNKNNTEIADDITPDLKKLN